MAEDDALASVSLRVPNVAGGGRLTRHAVVAVVRRWAVVDAETRDTIELLASELITNALWHAAPAPGRERRIGVRIALCRDSVRLAVDDPDPTMPLPRPGYAYLGELGEGGRGLLTVARLAKEWGHEPGPCGGKTVWCVIPLPAA